MWVSSFVSGRSRASTPRCTTGSKALSPPRGPGSGPSRSMP